jgi:hypothetical protein
MSIYSVFDKVVNFDKIIDERNEALKKIDLLRSCIKDLEADLDRVRRERDAAASSDRWFWSETDPNYLDSMTNEMVVSMRAGELRELLKKSTKCTGGACGMSEGRQENLPTVLDTCASELCQNCKGSGIQVGPNEYEIDECCGCDSTGLRKKTDINAEELLNLIIDACEDAEIIKTESVPVELLRVGGPPLRQWKTYPFRLLADELRKKMVECKR